MRGAHAGLRQKSLEKARAYQSLPEFLTDDQPLDQERSTEDDTSVDDMRKREVASRIDRSIVSRRGRNVSAEEDMDM